MPRLLLPKQLIGEIALDSGRIVELRVFSGFQNGTPAASKRPAVSPLSVLGGVLVVGPPLVTGSH
jgi:hypothetical protein